MKDIGSVPKNMKDKYTEITVKTDAFCEKYLNDEYRGIIHRGIASLCRKRPSPLLKGAVESWAAGIVHAIGSANFLFDKTQTPYCSVSDIYSFFVISAGTGQSRSKTIREFLKITPLSFEWLLPSRMEHNPAIWMLSVNGLIVDIRRMPIEVQEMAYEKGMIPYVPGNHHA